MSTQTQLPQNRDNAVDCLERLCAALSPEDQSERRRSALGSIKSAIDQVMTEHAGMADELLLVYEQLGVIFEITRELPTVQEESEIVTLFVASLRRSFQQRRVLVAQRSSAGAWSFDDGAFSGDRWLTDFVERGSQDTGVVVEPWPDENLQDSFVEAMVGPVWSGDTLLFSIVLLRASEAVEFRASEMLLVESLTNFCGDLIRNHRLVQELRELSVSMVRSLVNAVDQKDEYTCGHSLRVAFYATKLGRHLKMREVDLQMLQWSALLHDVGKIGIRDDVLKKEGRLTDDEFSHIKEHPVRSHRVVREVPQLSDALDGILYHHEHYDGAGYPKGLVGEEIPLQARIIQIADVFDALTSNRSYRKAYDWRAALDVMAEEAGTTIDPRLQREFDGLIRGELEGNPDAWVRIVRQANSFAQTVEEVIVDNRES